MKPALLIFAFAISGVFTSPYGKSVGGAGGYHTGAGAHGQQQAAPGSSYSRQSGGSVQYGHQTDDGGQQYFNRNQDGSYDFGYNTGTGAFQSESKTASGQVTGKYGHTGPDGSYVNVEYSGVSTGDGGQYSGGSQGQSFSSGGSQSSGQYSSGDKYAAPYQAPAPGAPAYRAPAAPYSAPAGASTQYKAAQYSQNVARGPAESAAFNLERKGDGSYSYSYTSGDGTKTESGSPDGQVEGSFSFRGDDGVQRSLGYSAGQQGFLATGAHVPTTDDGTPAAGTSTGGGFPASPASYSSQQSYAAKAGKPFGFDAPQQRIAPTSGTQQAYAGGAKAYQYGGSGGGGSSGFQNLQESYNESPKPFSFSYSAGDHGRQESQDASGVVRGSYVVNTPDGTHKELTYQADDSGFHIIDEKQSQTGGGSAGYSGAPAAGYSGAPAAAYPGGAGSYQAPRTAPGVGAGYPTGAQQQHYNQKSAYYR